MAEAAGRPPGVFDETFLTGIEGVTEVLLIRHGQVDYDPEATVGDLADPSLTQQGWHQVRLLAEALSTIRLAAVFTSPMRRAMETAEAMLHHHRDLQIEVIPDLREVEVFRDAPPDKTLREFLGAELLGALRHRMLTERNWDVYPHSEPSYDFRKRCINAIEAAIARNAGERIAIVCHGGVINAYTGHIIGTPYDMFFRPANASVSIVAAGGGRRVIRLLNDTHHLTTAEGDFATY